MIKKEFKQDVRKKSKEDVKKHSEKWVAKNHKQNPKDDNEKMFFWKIREVERFWMETWIEEILKLRGSVRNGNFRISICLCSYVF